jgi:Skp family chaperone for outer membrane proteins
VQVMQGEGQAKRAQLQDVTPSRHRQTAQQKAWHMAEQREQEESERKEGAQQQENEAREREAAQAIWMRE